MEYLDLSAQTEVEVIEALATCNPGEVQSLCVRGCGLTDVGARAVAEFMQRRGHGTYALSEINLGGNPSLTPAGVQMIAEALAGCSVESLDLSECLLSDESVRNLAAAMERSKGAGSLVSLNLSSASITSVEPIAHLLRTNTSLKSLYMDSCFVEDLRPLASCLEHHNGTLAFASFTLNTPASPPGLQHVHDAVKANEALWEELCALTDEEVSKKERHGPERVVKAAAKFLATLGSSE